MKYTAKYCLTNAIDYQLGHRKDKPLKGILEADSEEPKSTSDSESETDDMTEGAEEPQALEQKTKEDRDVVVDGLLGEGLKEGMYSLAPANLDAKQTEKLVDMFG